MDIAPTLSPAHRHGARDAEQGSRGHLYFWIVKVLCTTVGETASDYIAGTSASGSRRPR
jgi:uncharacterized membrane-anchored protein